MTHSSDHYNLYYIFEEDKRRHPLPADVAARLWENVLYAVNEDDP